MHTFFLLLFSLLSLSSITLQSISLGICGVMVAKSVEMRANDILSLQSKHIYHGGTSTRDDPLMCIVHMERKTTFFERLRHYQSSIRMAWQSHVVRLRFIDSE